MPRRCPVRRGCRLPPQSRCGGVTFSARPLAGFGPAFPACVTGAWATGRQRASVYQISCSPGRDDAPGRFIAAAPRPHPHVASFFTGACLSAPNSDSAHAACTLHATGEHMLVVAWPRAYQYGLRAGRVVPARTGLAYNTRRRPHRRTPPYSIVKYQTVAWPDWPAGTSSVLSGPPRLV